MNILLTGGSGCIGDHTTVVLAEVGHEAVTLNNLCNSKHSVFECLQKILGKLPPHIEGDISKNALVVEVLQECKIDAVIHFAGLKAVGESVEKPIDYYASNVQDAINFLKATNSVNVKTLVFSSSQTVYDNSLYLPIDENHPASASNVCGRSKIHIDGSAVDIANSSVNRRILCLLYFNSVRAYMSVFVGEDPCNTPNNPMPYFAMVTPGCLPH